jgi:hypothetical protein
MLTRWDKWLIVGVLLLACGGFFWGNGLNFSNTKKTAVIEINGRVQQSIPLTPGHKQILTVPGYSGKIEIDGERIRVRDDDTPRKIGVHTGWITKAPQTIVVVPYRLVIRIIQEQADVDEITR